LILASLIVGVASLDDIKKLSSLGGKTLAVYFLTTIIALTIGLGMVNLIKPGKYISKEVREKLTKEYSSDVEAKKTIASKVENQGPLSFLVNMVPKNVFGAASDNKNMLQVVVFALLIGIATAMVPNGKAKPFLDMMLGFNEVMLKVIDIIMMMAPIGVFALLASLIVEVPDVQLLGALGVYGITVIIALGIMAFVVYPLMIHFFSNKSIKDFYRAMRPAQLLAFSTSSSSATLPLTIKQCEKKLGLKEQVCGFVLPLGATINMDGTSLYQGVAAVFIAQAIGMDLSLGDQIIIVLTALLASIGSAGVPGAGMVMLVIVLESVNIPLPFLALIMAPDRILDMFRTTVNVTGDATVATIMDAIEEKKN
jgi:Na+/H+-dicarboxylate symporter